MRGKSVVNSDSEDSFPSNGEVCYSVKWGPTFAEWWCKNDILGTSKPVRTTFDRKHSKFIAAFKEEFGVTIPTRGWGKER